MVFSTKCASIGIRVISDLKSPYWTDIFATPHKTSIVRCIHSNQIECAECSQVGYGKSFLPGIRWTFERFRSKSEYNREHFLRTFLKYTMGTIRFSTKTQITRVEFYCVSHTQYHRLRYMHFQHLQFVFVFYFFRLFRSGIFHRG